MSWVTASSADVFEGTVFEMFSVLVFTLEVGVFARGRLLVAVGGVFESDRRCTLLDIHAEKYKK